MKYLGLKGEIECLNLQILSPFLVSKLYRPAFKKAGHLLNKVNNFWGGFMNKLGTVITGLASLFSFSSFAANSLKTKTINVTKVVADFIAVERGDLVRSNDLVEYIDRNFTDFEIKDMERKIGFGFDVIVKGGSRNGDGGIELGGFKLQK